MSEPIDTEAMRAWFTAPEKHGTPALRGGQVLALLDEIDRLRAERRSTLRLVWQAHNAGMDEGIGSPFPETLLAAAADAVGATAHQRWDAGIDTGDHNADTCDDAFCAGRRRVVAGS